MERLFKCCLAVLIGFSILSKPTVAHARDINHAPAQNDRDQHIYMAVVAQVQAHIIVRVDIINLRSGPDTSYPNLGQLQRSQICPITGRDVSNAWWQVQCLGIENGWVFGQLVDLVGNTSGIPVISVAPPLAAAVPPPLPIFYGWQASYFNNHDLAGAPVAQADVGDINFNWGGGSPHPAVPADNFSARFERVINFNPGSYRFTARTDDGIRLWIDNQLVIDQWPGLGDMNYTADRYMSGNQSVRVEYYEAGGAAYVSLTFAPLLSGGGGGGVNPGSDWEASYFNNPDLAGGPVIVRGEARSSYPLDLDWNLSSPAPGAVGNDNWSARWRGRFFFEAGDYTFRARSDDGVRVYIDGIRLLDAWYDGYKEPANRFLSLGRGDHEIIIEFYERGGTAFNRIWWYRDDTSGDQSVGAASSGSGSSGRDRDQ